MTGRRLPLRWLAVVIGCPLLTLTACTSDSEPRTEATKPPSERPPAVASVDSYCEIQVLRQMIADGEVKRSQLPDFADTTEVDGTPRVLDFTVGHRESSAAFLDRLYASPGMRSVRPDRAAVSTCMDEATEADVERTQGRPGYLSPAAERGELEACGGFGCYEIPAITPTYCEVQGIRDLVRDGTLSAADLPRDANLTKRDGAPLLIDFRDRNSTSSRTKAYLEESLRPAVATAGAKVDRAALRACLDSMTQTTIEKTQGGTREH